MDNYDSHVLLITKSQEKIAVIKDLMTDRKTRFHYGVDHSNSIKIISQDQRINFIFIDFDFDSKSLISFISKIRKINSKIGILVLFDSLPEEVKLQFHRFSSVFLISLRQNRTDLINNINNLFSVLTNDRVNLEAAKMLRYEKRIYKIPSSLHYIYPISEHLTRDLFLIGINDYESLIKIKIGLQEMMINAIEHGNLGITFDDKVRLIAEGNDMSHLIEEVTSRSEYQVKWVTIEYTLTSKMAKYSITDEGAGFDWRTQINNNPDQVDLSMVSGRGILLTKNSFDEFYYNERGNRVVLIVNAKN